MESSSPSQPSGQRLRNLLIAIAAIVLTSALFLGINLEKSSTSLNAVAAAAMPLDSALANQQPTVMEFYADWCASCQSMAADNLVLQQQYGDRVNFVMLNVDNNKWLPEITKHKVDGIPHFVFLANDNTAIGNTVGAVPHNMMVENIEAMINHKPLPYNRLSTGQTSDFDSPRPADLSNPKAHS